MARHTRKKSPFRSRSGSASMVISAAIGLMAAAWYVWGEDLGIPFPAPSVGAETSTPAIPEPTVIAADPPPAMDGAITGTASVIDADTLDIGSERIRLVGIDAPESGQRCRDAKGALVRCGSIAANALDAWINRNPVTCILEGRDRYKRALGKCSVRGQRVQDWLVRNGHAVAYRQYSTEFVEAELAAREARAGIWAGDFIMPSDWRKGVRLDGEARTAAAADAR
jgi:endonuclease YncB( thermonuclease family)